ncbi:unnamed protein product [Thlaspi arvense]|uniref:Uncharacterized protein n=1 Tax=Thlaspi arvense TaxID=13288 RepID=A0AAU9T3E0_THLAR|nr:unnamed protein product [Thlaspi arvense]
MVTSGEISKLHFFFFPFMAHGHMIPTLDMAKLFATKGAKSTILTTPLNANLFEKPIKSFNHQNPELEDITIQILDFPCTELGLPEGCENTDFIYSSPDLSKGDLNLKFLLSMTYFKEQLDQLLETVRPDCLVANMFFPWATEVAEKYNVPRLVFHGTGYFSLCASHCLRLHKPYKNAASSSEPFVIPDLPGDIVITEEQVIEKEEESVMGKFMKGMRESERNSFGVLVNSFYDLEPAYSDFFKISVAQRAWDIGPLSLGNREFKEKAERGKKASIDEHECLKWLDSKKPDSVIYISFGSMSSFTNEQLIEIAAGLEMSGHGFVWVVSKNGSQGEKEEWLPEGFEEKTKGEGLIIRGWAPQVLILDHQAIGGFLTHCGWNSLLEGVASGLPMVTWPVGAEQFYNEKLVTQVLKTGVSVGVKKMSRVVGDFISRDKVDRAVREVMAGEERRKRAKELAEMAKDAVKEGGSSDLELDRLMEEIKLVKLQNEKDQRQTNMSSDPRHKLHVMFFPFMAYGHIIPTLDMAKLFSTRGAKSTIITTPLNSKILQKPIDLFKNLNPSLEIDIHIFDFPCVELGLPEGCENVDFFTANNNEDREYITLKFFLSTRFFKDQLEKLLEKTRPDCLIADMFFPWATEAADKCHVPRLVFHGTGYFSLCAGYCIKVHKPQNRVASSCEPFLIPDLPGDIVITQEQIIDGDNESGMGKFMIEVRESEVKSSGVVVNSFYELESDYADFYKRFVAKRAWHIGPLSVINRGFEEKAERGKKASIDEAECLKWLDSKKPDSVIYISFGSVASFKNEQLIEIAAGLEASGINFIWVVRKNTDEKEEWLPEGMEERTKGKGMIIRGWAPQVLILEHQATGGFVTHCGWNSLLEGVAAGLQMVTWPIGAEQFYNEKLVTQVLRTGVSVGATKHVKVMEDFIIGREKVEKAVREVLLGEEAEERRTRAKKMAEMAKAAVEEGGSSFNDLNNFIQEFSP